MVYAHEPTVPPHRFGAIEAPRDAGGAFLENNTDDLSAADIQVLLADAEVVAFGYVRARTGVEHTDPTREAWLDPQRIDLRPAEPFTRTAMVVVVTNDSWTTSATDAAW